GAVVGRSNIQQHVVAAGDLECFLPSFDRTFLAVVPVLITLDAFHIEVSDVGGQVGKAPRNVLVVTNNDTGQARKAEPTDIIGALLADFCTTQVHLMPYRWQRGAQVWIVC